MDSADLPSKEPTLSRLYLSRLLTRTGDQAWDFALPLALIILFPHKLQLGIGLFFLSKLLFALLIPLIGVHMDRWSFKTAVRYGIGLQTLGVIAGAALIAGAYQNQGAAIETANLRFVGWFAAVAASMLVSGVGAQIMDVFISQEVMPALFPRRLTVINARIRQIDLATEVGSPVITGLVLAACTAIHPLLGFKVIAAWNVVSFLPEYLLIKPYLGHMAAGERHAKLGVPKSIFSKYHDGYQAFKRHKLAVPVIAYALLWLSALSPHGVLLTTFLKGGWNLPETELGIFRGLGAVFGVSATFLFPLLARRIKLLKTSACFITWQAVNALAAAACFTWSNSPWFFLTAVLLSRIGLYGFIQGETELRQTLTAPGERGSLNGFASALNQSATLLLFFIGTIFTSPDEFGVIITASASSVCAGALLFLWWARTQGGHVQTRT